MYSLITIVAYLFFLLLLLLPLLVLLVIAQWKMFAKAGEPGWKVFIPGYGTYIYYKISTLKRPLLHTIVVAVLSVLTFIVTESVMMTNLLSNTSDMSVFWQRYPGYFILELVMMSPVLVLNAISYYKMSKAFGRSTGFAVGCILLPNIFQLILGFGKAQYVAGKAEVKQIEAGEPTPEIEKIDE